MIITDITPIDKRKARVCIDNFYTFPLYLSEIRRFSLKTGDEYSEDTATQIHLLLKKRLQERILYYITDCDRTERDIRRKMKSAGYPEDILDEVIEQLKEYRYIDDERYARTYLELSADGKPYKYIENKLFEKGLSKDVIKLVMEDYEGDEESMIIAELRKKGYSIDSLSEIPLTERRRLYAFLARKGFSPDKIRNAFHGMDDFDD